jgi:SNF2 family DNA or RNA helicase
MMELDDFAKTTPYDHQRACFERSKDEPLFAVLWEQGCGKTKLLLDTAAHLYLEDEIDGLFVVAAPNGVHVNWVEREIPKHLSDRIDARCVTWRARTHTTKKFQKTFTHVFNHDGLAVLAMNVEALSQRERGSAAYARAKEFLKERRCLFIVDESSRIKTPRSIRTRNVIKLGKLAPYRRIATGTPVTQSPFDLYSQMGFLNYDILGFSSYYAFRHQFGTFVKQVATDGAGRPYNYEQLIQYVRLDQLRRLIQPASDRTTKAECLDLPDKIYQTVPLQMTPVQTRLYKNMMDEGAIEIPDEGIEVLAPLQITRLLRCQQILGGFLPSFNPHIDNSTASGIPIDGPNPKLNVLMEMLEDECAEKTIVWARFRFEIQMIRDAIAKAHGRGSVVEFHGGVVAEHRESAIDAFQSCPDVRYLVGQQASGMGVTLTAAKHVLYFSNSFSREHRLQSEDRAHRIGTRHPVTYIDLVMEDTVDERIREVLIKAGAVADEITGDLIRLIPGNEYDQK